jgi:hypothetical protein
MLAEIDRRLLGSLASEVVLLVTNEQPSVFLTDLP